MYLLHGEFNVTKYTKDERTFTVASLLNIFLVKSAGFRIAISIVTVLVFLRLTAYDVAKKI